LNENVGGNVNVRRQGDSRCNTHVSIVSKIYLFNHCQKHNLNAGRRVPAHPPLSDGQNRLEESSRTKDAALLYTQRFDFPPSLSYSLSSALGFSRESTRFRHPRRVTHAPRATLSVLRSIFFPLFLYFHLLFLFLVFFRDISVPRLLSLLQSEFLQNLEYVFP